MTDESNQVAPGTGDRFRFDLDRLTEFGCGSDLRLAGADEAGRGSLAGPLVAAAVVFDYSDLAQGSLEGLTDSKLLSHAKRERLYPEIIKSARAVASVGISASTIDRMGLHTCNLEALRQALDVVMEEYAVALVDGFDLKRPELRATRVVSGDVKSAAVAAASVVAKVVRDRVMRAVAPSYPDYGFETHVGYGTAFHRQAIIQHGPCALHRLSFNGVGSAQMGLWSDDE